jgi:hypothetical protein
MATLPWHLAWWEVALLALLVGACWGLSTAAAHDFYSWLRRR